MKLWPVNFALDLPLLLPPKPAPTTVVPWRSSRLQPYGRIPMTPITVLPALGCRSGERCDTNEWHSFKGLGDCVDGIGLSALGISVDVKIPKAITEAAKLAPSIAHQFPAYAHELQKESAKVTGTVDAINIGLQSLGVALIFGGIITVLILREKPKN